MTVAVVVTGASSANLMKQWEYILSNFKPDVLYVDGVTSNWSSYISAQPLVSLDKLPGELVVMAPITGRYVQGEKSLSTFSHPTDVTYWFGQDHRNLDPDRFSNRKPDHLVYIDTDTKDQMYAHVAYAVVVWDRRMKAE